MRRSHPPSATPKSGRRLWTGLATLLAFVTIAIGFDATWLRPLVRHYVRQHAGRQIDFDSMQLRLDARFRPVIKLRNLQVENADWAAARPLVRAAQFDLTIAWESFRGNGMVVPLLAIVDGDIDLEQQADGLRNWRLADPQNRGPGRVRIQAIQAVRSQLRFVHAGQQLEFDLATVPLAAPHSLASHPDLPMTQSLRLNGRRGSVQFAGVFDASSILTLRDSGTDFALRGHIESGPTNLEIEGLAHDLQQFAGFDVDLHLTSSNLHSLGVVFGANSLPPLVASGNGRVHKDGRHWAVAALQARVGKSDLAGALEFDRGAGTSTAWRATLTSERLDLSDWRPPEGSVRAAVSTPALDAARPTPPDGEIDLTVAKLEGLPLGRIGAVRALHAHAVMRASRLAIAPLRFTVAGGAATGNVSVNAERSPPEAAVDLQLSGLRLDELTAPRPGAERPDGGLNLRIALQSRGTSFAAWRDSAAGHVSATLQHATLPAKMEAQLALDGGQWMRAMLQPGKRVAVTCAVADMEFALGQGRSRHLAIETDNVLLSGTAAVDLKRQSFELLLTPHRKQAALLALDKSVRLSGGFKQPKVALVASDDAPAAAGCTRVASSR